MLLYTILIPIISLIAIIWFLIRYLREQNSLITVILWGILWIAVTLFAIFPSSSSYFASLFGIARGLDFVIIVDSLKLTQDEKFYLEDILSKKNNLKKEFLEYENFVKMGILHESSLYNLGFYKLGCDFFQVVKYDTSHRMYTEYIKERDDWISWWGHQRNGVEKGFLNLPVEYGGD